MVSRTFAKVSILFFLVMDWPRTLKPLGLFYLPSKNLAATLDVCGMRGDKPPSELGKETESLRCVNPLLSSHQFNIRR